MIKKMYQIKYVRIEPELLKKEAKEIIIWKTC